MPRRYVPIDSWEGRWSNRPRKPWDDDPFTHEEGCIGSWTCPCDCGCHNYPQ